MSAKWIAPLSALALAVLGTLFTGAALAQANPAKTTLSVEDSYFEDLPVVLTASRLSQPQSEAPSAITVIDQKMIQASGFRTVPELMRLVPGMYVGFADANRPVVTLHGSADEYSRRMQVLVDGRSVYLPPFGNVNWASLPVLFEDIERIEVVRGPSSASHGSNAFYGTINIITFAAGAENGASVSVKGGAATDVSARISAAGPRFDYRLSFGSRSDSGLELGKLNDYSTTRLLNLRASYHPNFTDSVDLQLGGSEGVYGLGIYGRPEDAFRETTARTDYQVLSWHHIWTRNDESRLTFSRTAFRTQDPHLCVDSDACQGTGLIPPPPGWTGFVAQTNTSERTEIELENTHQLSNNNRLVWGAGARMDKADYALFLAAPTQVSPWRVFAHDEWRATPQTVFNLGAMLESDGFGNTSSSPRASVNYHLTPQQTLRLGWSTATRSPAMSEAVIRADNNVLGGMFVQPLELLRPERIESREIGYLGEFRSLALTVDVRLYQERVKDQIWYDKWVIVTPNIDASPDSFKNLISSEYKGLEVTVKHQWDEGRSFLVGSYAYQEAEAGLSALPTQYNSTVSGFAGPSSLTGFPSWGALLQAFYTQEYFAAYPEFTPQHSMSLLASQDLGSNWRLGARYYYRSQMRVGDVSSDVTPETAMQRLDLNLSKSFKLDKGRRAELTLVVQNATQSEYTKYGTVNAAAEMPFVRRAWLGATFSF